MKRLVTLLVVGVAAVAIAIALMTYPANKDAEFPGYMEADLVLVGSEQGGRVAALSVEEGDHVKQGDPIFVLESEEQDASVAAAKSRVQEAEARLADVKAQLQRPGEIEVLEASLAQAQAMLQQSNNNLDRARALFAKGWITKAQLDDAVAQHDRNQAAVAEADRRITAAKLPGRSDMIDAAAANAEAARHALIEAEKNLGKRSVVAPASGTVEEVYFRPGEVVKEGQAVVALLPPRNLKVRFFVAEPVRASLQIDQTISLSCDGCPPGLHAKISFIARDAEFTPPVIFSREQREKLVFLVEARPDGAATELTAGQPITVNLGPRQQVVRR
ncbi:MAG: HlyD family efflux transporter periplasmic adaptor subunit [Methyloceanibacter sp.]|jgi:HlyD family secretion protein|nr:HlyD family efflux transporter periplasmic adaptor subunit [Methyloceanibacter sp.]